LSELGKMWSNTRMVVLTSVSAALYVALLIPFKFIQIIPSLAELRPAAAIPAACSLLFGPAGAFGAAFGNLIGDFFGTLGPGSIPGIIGNFLYGYLPYKIYRALAQENFNWKIDLRKWFALQLAVALAVSSAFLIASSLWNRPLTKWQTPFPNSILLASAIRLAACSCAIVVGFRLWKMPLRRWSALQLAIALGGCACGVVIGFGLDLMGIVPFKVLANWICFNNLFFGLTLGPLVLLSVFPYIKDSGLFYRDLLQPKQDTSQRKILSILGIILVAAGVLLALFFGNFPGRLETLLGLSGKALSLAGAGPGVILIILGALII